MVMRVGYVTVDMLVPAPDSPKAQPKLTIEAKREMVIDTHILQQSSTEHNSTIEEFLIIARLCEWSQQCSFSWHATFCLTLAWSPFRRGFCCVIRPWGRSGWSLEVRRQHAAAEILQTLQAKMADSGGGGGEAGGARGTCGRGPSGVSW